jgi:hypothetical protein
LVIRWNPDRFHLAEKKVENAGLHPVVRFITETWNEDQDISIKIKINLTISLCYGLTAGRDIDFKPFRDHSDDHVADFAAYMRKMEGISGFMLKFCDAVHPENQGNAIRYGIAALCVGEGRRLFITSQGHIGIGSVAIRNGDLVCILFGYQLPAVLRPHGANYQYVGNAYVHNLKGGGGLQDYKSGKQASEEFNLC